MKEKVFKYSCPSCGEKYNRPKKNEITKMKICPKCGYIACSGAKTTSLEI